MKEERGNEGEAKAVRCKEWRGPHCCAKKGKMKVSLWASTGKWHICEHAPAFLGSSTKFAWHCHEVQYLNRSRQAWLIVETFILKGATRSFGCRFAGSLYKPWIVLVFLPVCLFLHAIYTPYRRKRQEASSGKEARSRRYVRWRPIKADAEIHFLRCICKQKIHPFVFPSWIQLSGSSRLRKSSKRKGCVVALKATHH